MIVPSLHYHQVLASSTKISIGHAERCRAVGAAAWLPGRRADGEPGMCAVTRVTQSERGEIQLSIKPKKNTKLMADDDSKGPVTTVAQPRCPAKNARHSRHPWQFIDWEVRLPECVTM